MKYNFTTFLLIHHLLVLLSVSANVVSCRKELEVVNMAREAMLHAMTRAEGYKTLDGPGRDSGSIRDCFKLYEEAEPRLLRLVSGDQKEGFSHDDAVTWLSAALASHTTCLDELGENGWLFEARRAENLTALIREALGFYGPQRIRRGKRKGITRKPSSSQVEGLLASWNPATSKTDFVVAQDGSGNYRTINDAVAAVARLGQNRPERVVVYVKSGVYKEKVEIGTDLKNVMFVGDGMDKTVVTGNQNVQDGATTVGSATFGMMFENTAGPQKHQAVALRVTSDLSVFYQCAFKCYQDTLLVHSLRQFYRDCQIFGTVDFIFGNAVAVFQNCNIIIRRPMNYQFNTITAQGRDNPNENTGISILNSRVLPADDFRDVSRSFRNYLGRPWKKYSRTVFIKTDLDGLVDGKGWKEWDGDFALSTLYYAEYMNRGNGAYTRNRVKWPGFRVLSDAREASRFSTRNFIRGNEWIPVTGVPFWIDL